jgi:hypothetical protein
MLNNELTRLFKTIILNESTDFKIIESVDSSIKPYPYLLNKTQGKKQIEGWLVSAVHGRSIIASADNNEYTILKGSGLSYTLRQYVNISEYKYGHIWGHLSKCNGIREYKLGNLFSKLGGIGPKYEALIRIDDYNQKNLVGLNKLIPYLLQYKIKCPIRISDIGLYDRKEIIRFLEENNAIAQNTFHLYFANICIDNLLILHNNNFFYNSLSIYNTSLLGEFVDFESSFTMDYFCPKEGFKDYESLMNREIINLFQVITVFADILNEKINYKELNYLFRFKYCDKLKNVSQKKYIHKFHQLIHV